MNNNNEEQQSAQDNNNEMSYFDRVVFEAGGTADDVNGDISSSDDEQDGKTDVEDDSSIWSEVVDADESSDEEMEYDSDEDSVHLLLPSAEVANNNQTISKSLSEASKQLLLWRLDKDESFSDWTIEVFIANKRNRKKIYHVHKVTLAIGPKKSGYFEALLTSGQFSESSNSTSVVELSDDIAKYFDIFLDYMYTHPSECACLINRDNRSALQYFAKYFLVPKLTEDIHDFIKKDMNLCFVSMAKGHYGRSEERQTMMGYLTEFGGAEDNDESRHILAFATRICAVNILHIDSMMFREWDGGCNNDSSLVPYMSPAMFLNMMSEIRKSQDILTLIDGDDVDDRGRYHICQLVIDFIRHLRASIDANYFIELTNEILFPEDTGLAARVALDLLEIMEDTGCNKDISGSIESVCIAIISKHLSDIDVSDRDDGYEIELPLWKITQKVSRHVLNVLLRTQTLNTKMKGQKESFNVSCKLMDDYYGKEGTILNITINSTDTIDYVRYLLSRKLNSGFNIMDSIVRCEGKTLGVHHLWNGNPYKKTIHGYMMDQIVWNTSISPNCVLEISQ